MSEFAQAIAHMLSMIEPVSHDYGPSVHRFYAFHRRFLVTIIDAEEPSCTVVDVFEPARIERFTDARSIRMFFDSRGQSLRDEHI